MQKYLLDNNPAANKLPQYSIMTAYIRAVEPLIKRSLNSKNYGFNPTGMGRTKIGEALYKGESPQPYYNLSIAANSLALKRELLIREFFHQAPKSWAKRRHEKSWLKPGAEADKLFKAWKAGETGYILIDAGMTQLATEGWMPNRVRMLCASFLTKNMGVWWERGEKYFASKLIDYNPDSNLGNWQYVSGVGFNARLADVLSPDIQLKTYDSNLDYCRSVLGSKLINEYSAIDFIREPDLYPIPQITNYKKSKERYLKQLS
jgi:deoxyribodipyrimidine photo-lyase